MIRRIKSFFRPYAAVFRMRFKVETHYRAAALGGFITQSFFGFILIALYRALYQTTPQAQPLSAVVTYVWIQQAFFRMLLSSDSELMQSVRMGAMAYEMCRPLSPYGFYYSRAAAQKIVGTFLRAVPMLLIAFLLPDGWRLSLPCGIWQCILFFVSIFFGLINVCALDNIGMAFTIRSLDNKGITNALSLLQTALSGNILPLTLFPDAWQKAIRFTPYAQLIDAPIRIYTGEYALPDALFSLSIQLFWGCVLIGLGLYMWQKNQKHIIVQGG